MNRKFHKYRKIDFSKIFSIPNVLVNRVTAISMKRSTEYSVTRRHRLVRRSVPVPGCREIEHERNYIIVDTNIELHTRNPAPSLLPRFRAPVDCSGSRLSASKKLTRGSLLILSNRLYRIDIGRLANGISLNPDSVPNLITRGLSCKLRRGILSRHSCSTKDIDERIRTWTRNPVTFSMHCAERG